MYDKVNKDHVKAGDLNILQSHIQLDIYRELLDHEIKSKITYKAP